MFKISTEPTFTHEVTALAPVDGGYDKQTFKATYRAISPEDTDSYKLGNTDGSTAFLKRVIVKLDDIADAEGKALPWNDELLEQVLRLPWARKALANAYFTAISKAQEGN